MIAEGRKFTVDGQEYKVTYVSPTDESFAATKVLSDYYSNAPGEPREYDVFVTRSKEVCIIRAGQYEYLTGLCLGEKYLLSDSYNSHARHSIERPASRTLVLRDGKKWSN